MKRLIMMAILKMCGKAIVLTMIAGMIIGVIGYMNKWDTSLADSNAFFIAGCLLIIVGGMSRVLAGQDWVSLQYLYAESFRNMSSSEKANYVIDASSTVGLVVLGVLSGILLILISVIVAEMF